MTPKHRIPALVITTFVCLAAVAGATSGSTPIHAVGAAELKARQIVERAIAAHGGRENWLRKKDASYSTTWTHYRDGRPTITSRYVVKFPTSGGPVSSVVEAEENGKPVVMGISGGSSWFLVGGERYEDLESLRANRSFVRRAYSLLAVPFCLEDPSTTFTYDGEEVRSAMVVDRVRVEHGLDPPGFYLFDRESGRLVGMGSPLADPPTATIGESLDFTDVDGIVIPRTQLFDRVDPRTRSRSRALSVSVDLVRFDNGFGPEIFEPPPAP